MSLNSSTGNSFGSKMDRIKPEKLPRQRVQKLWRNVRWAEAFPDDSLTVDEKDLTPNFALRKVALLFETKKFNECASLIRRLNCVTLGSILHEVPIDVLHDSLPQSLGVLEALYTKLYETSESPAEFPREELQVDHFLQKLVAMFAKQSRLNNKHEKNSNSVYPSCRSILRVISWVEPSIRRLIRQRKRALDKCLRHLGRHGLVESSEGTLMNLHDAFKIEFEQVVGQYRSALHKLEELNMSAKHPTGSSVIFGPAPSASSHHRMMQLTRDDVQERIIKNRTLFNLSEPAVSNQYLRKFIHILEKRIEYDKIVLFHDTELKKLNKQEHGDAHLSVSLKEFSQGYASVLMLLKEVTDEDILTEEEEDAGIVSSDEETISPLMHKDRMRSLSGLNAFLPYKNTGGMRPSIIHVGQTFHHGSTNGLNNGYLHLHNGTLPVRIGKMLSLGEDKKDQELEILRSQLEKSHDMVKHLQEREAMYIDQLTQQQKGYHGVTENGDSSGERVAELVRSYARLYHEDRALALQTLDSLEDLKEVHTLKGKILFSVVVLAFRSVQQQCQELRGKLRHMLNLPVATTNATDDPVSMEMESSIEHYVCKTAERFDTTQCIQEVSSQIFATLYDYPCLKVCEGLKQYIINCVNTAWTLSVHKPPYIIVYDSRIFQHDIHVRTESSNSQSVQIQNFLWPTLLESTNTGPCMYKGIVET